jgi:predicted ABC-type sugar transport system permease subunit
MGTGRNLKYYPTGCLVTGIDKILKKLQRIRIADVKIEYWIRLFIYWISPPISAYLGSISTAFLYASSASSSCPRKLRQIAFPNHESAASGLILSA